jgi:hypothetical protein
MKVLFGLLWLIVVIGNGLAMSRRQRRSGEVHSDGHPMKDNLLLLGSAIVLAATMSAVIWWMGPHAPRLKSPAGQVLVLIFLVVAAGITYLANHLNIRRRRISKSD